MPDPASRPFENRPFENMGRKLDEHLGNFGDRVEDDVRHVISFLNDRVVPEVRQNSSVALRAAAEQLARLADHLDSRSQAWNRAEGEPHDQPPSPPGTPPER